MTTMKHAGRSRWGYALMTLASVALLSQLFFHIAGEAAAVVRNPLFSVDDNEDDRSSHLGEALLLGVPTENSSWSMPLVPVAEALIAFHLPFGSWALGGLALRIFCLFLAWRLGRVLFLPLRVSRELFWDAFSFRTAVKTPFLPFFFLRRRTFCVGESIPLPREEASSWVL